MPVANPPSLVDVVHGRTDAEFRHFLEKLPTLVPAALVPVAPPRDARGDGADGACGPSCRILVVDDNRDAAHSLSLLLRLLGHRTHSAHDGLEAVQAAAAFRPDLVLLDIGLPNISGYEAARCIRQEPWGADITLIALTGWGQEEDKRRAREAGFDHHLTKPVDPAELKALVAQFAGNRNGSRGT